MSGVLLAMSLPGLVLLLMVVGIVEQVANRTRRRALGAPSRGGMTGAGIDVLHQDAFTAKWTPTKVRSSSKDLERQVLAGELTPALAARELVATFLADPPAVEV